MSYSDHPDAPPLTPCLVTCPHRLHRPHAPSCVHCPCRPDTPPLGLTPCVAAHLIVFALLIRLLAMNMTSCSCPMLPPRRPQHDVELLESAGVPWYFSRGREFDSHCGRSLFRLWFLDFGCPACGEGLRATFGHEPVNPGPFGTGVVVRPRGALNNCKTHHHMYRRWRVCFPLAEMCLSRRRPLGGHPFTATQHRLPPLGLHGGAHSVGGGCNSRRTPCQLVGGGCGRRGWLRTRA